MKGQNAFWKTICWFILPLAGTCFCIGYILTATKDVVYSDYIRLINSYLPDVWNPEKFFVADIATRMPVNFLERIVNVSLFHYSTTAEMILGVLCLGGAGTVFSSYCREQKIGLSWYVLLMVIFFSLNKWEMLTNGTGWCHFLAFWGFYFHYLTWDRMWKIKTAKAGEKKAEEKKLEKCLFILPGLLILGTAGPYCAAYSAVAVFIYGVCFLLDWKMHRRADFRYAGYSCCVLVPMGLYLLSNSFAVTEYAKTTGRSLSQVIGDNLILFPKFLIKSFSSMVVGDEVFMDLLTKLNQGMWLCYLAGGLVLSGYLLAFWMQLREKLYLTSVFPLMLLLWGGLNHIFVLSARWIFENSSYGMSSRYAIQYQAGICGMILTFALTGKTKKQKKTKEAKQRAGQMAAWMICLVIAAGNLFTTWKEVKKAPNRREYAEKVAEAALHYRELSDEELQNRFQYHHGGERIRRALGILEEQKWNIYGGN